MATMTALPTIVASPATNIPADGLNCMIPQFHIDDQASEYGIKPQSAYGGLFRTQNETRNDMLQPVNRRLSTEVPVVEHATSPRPSRVGFCCPRGQSDVSQR